MPHMSNAEEFKDVGQDKSTHDATDKYDATYGKYSGNVEGERLQPGQVKEAPATFPTPFSIKGGK